MNKPMTAFEEQHSVQARRIRRLGGAARYAINEFDEANSKGFLTQDLEEAMDALEKEVMDISEPKVGDDVALRIATKQMPAGRWRLLEKY